MTNGHGLGDRAGRPVDTRPPVVLVRHAVERGTDSRPRHRRVERVPVVTAHHRRAVKVDTAPPHRAGRVDTVRRRKATPVDKAVRVGKVGRVRVATAHRRRAVKVAMVLPRKAVRVVRVDTVPRPRHTVNRANRAVPMALPVPRPMMLPAPIPVRRGRVATARNRLPVPVARAMALLWHRMQGIPATPVRGPRYMGMPMRCPPIMQTPRR